ncbi:MAG: hypothetical protein J6D87_07625 [Clostridia bacterium]|nr:hypothetical protein [Clostridia bacterium]
MKHIRIEKNDTGYILRQSTIFQGMTTLFLLMMLSLAALPWVIFAVTGMLHAEGTLLLALVCTAGLGGIGCYFFCVSIGQRVLVDHEGVRVYHFGRCKREMPWRYVKSWGIACMKNHYSHRSKDQYYLYFSTKSGERLGKHCISLLIDPKEKGELRRSGLYDFISAHRGEDEDEGYL